MYYRRKKFGRGRRMSATKRAYLAGLRKGKAIGRKRRYSRRRRW